MHTEAKTIAGGEAGGKRTKVRIMVTLINL